MAARLPKPQLIGNTSVRWPSTSNLKRPMRSMAPVSNMWLLRAWMLWRSGDSVWRMGKVVAILAGAVGLFFSIPFWFVLPQQPQTSTEVLLVLGLGVMPVSLGAVGGIALLILVAVWNASLVAARSSEAALFLLLGGSHNRVAGWFAFDSIVITAVAMFAALLPNVALDCTAPHLIVSLVLPKLTRRALDPAQLLGIWAAASAALIGFGAIAAFSSGRRVS
jgi:hypothetical protein